MEPGRPLCILDVSNEREWKIHTNTFSSVLRKVRDRPIVIYSINGATRSGKSFLLNYFVKHLQSLSMSPNERTNELFKWQSGLERVTIGIDLWSEPYFIQTDQGEVAVLLMDTQGLFDQETSYRQNAMLFTFSCLLSSVMMFNQKGLVTEDVLGNIERFSTYAKDIANRSSNLKSPSPYFSIDISSKLVFLLRDFEPPEYEYGLHNNVETPVNSERNFYCDMFENAKSIIHSQENLVTRQRILQIYPEVATYLFPHPGNTFVRQKIANTKNLLPEFHQQATSFVRQMLSTENLIKKTIRGQVVHGKHFHHNVNIIANICQNLDRHFSDVKNMKEFDDDIQLMRAVDTAFDYYKIVLNKFLELNPLGASDTELKATHEVAVVRAFDSEDVRRLTDSYESSRKDVFQKRLQERSLEEFETATKTNEKHRRAHMENIKKQRRAYQKKIARNIGVGVAVTAGVAAAVTAIVLTGGAGAGVAGAIIATKASIATAGTAGATVAVVGTTGASAAVVGAAAAGSVVVGAGASAGAAVAFGGNSEIKNLKINRKEHKDTKIN